MTDEIKLKPQYQLFADAYLKLFNETKAAIAAGFAERSAGNQGYRLMKRDDVRAYIDARMKESAMSATEVLRHLADIARGDFDDLVDRKGNVDLGKARESGKSNLIRRVKSRSILTTADNGDGTEIFETETEGYDRLKALELLGKHHKLFVDRQEVTGPDGKAVEIIVRRSHGNHPETD